jgi:hypothetical protein
MISRLLRGMFFEAQLFRRKRAVQILLLLSLTVLFAGCAESGPPTHFTVTTLHPGQVILHVPFEIDGTYESPGSGLVWVILEDSFGNSYLQSPPVQFTGDGKWVASNVRPLRGITAVRFVAVTSDGNTTFQSMVNDQKFGAFSQLPEGSMILLSVPITSQASIETLFQKRRPSPGRTAP